MKTSIVILTHNQLDYTLRCLESVQAHTSDYELIVVDNGSTDGTAELLRQSGFKTELNRRNEGFAKGCNQGLALAEGDNVLFLNNDTVVTAGWLEAMERLLEREPLCGMVGPVSNYVSGPQRVDAPYGPGIDGLEPFAAQRAAGWRGRSWELPRLVGFCLLLRRRLALEMGGFDEGYGLGNYEDDDLCLRLRRDGWRLLVACDSFVHHYGHVTMNALEDQDLSMLLEQGRQVARAKWGEDPVELLYRRSPAVSCSIGIGGEADEAALDATLASIRGLADEILLVHHGREGWERTARLGRERDLKTVRAELGEPAGARAALEEAGREHALWLRAGEELAPEEARRLLARLRRPEEPLAAIEPVRLRVPTAQPGAAGREGMQVPAAQPEAAEGERLAAEAVQPTRLRDAAASRLVLASARPRWDAAAGGYAAPLARPTGGGPAPVLRPGVTFETKCYERDWRELLLTDRLSRAIAQHRFPFAERILYVNNVERPELVLRHARRLVDEGVLTDCVLVDEHSEEALLFFGLTEEDFQGGYRYSIAELVALYRCRTEYLLHYAGDCMLEEPTDWLRPCLERMRLQRSIVAANPVPNGRMDEAAREALLTDGDFHLGYGFSDQCYLVRTLDFRARIYGERHPASERYPAYGGELFEKRVDAWMRVSGFMRLTWRRGSYWHRTLRSSEPELDLSAPALACYRAGAKAMEELDYESASVWLRLADLAVSCERQLGRRLDPDLRWLPRLQLAVCDDRLGRPELAWLSNEAAAVHAPPGQRSIEANREMMAERMSGGGSEQPLLSVLIPSLPERSASLSVLLERLRAQSHGRPVELLALTDNRLRTTGAKRNALLELAQGKFVAFVDDDDRIADGYAERLLAAIRSEPDADCIVFDVRVHADGSPSRLCRYGIELDHGSDAEGYTRKPNHLMAYRRELALRHRYLDIGYGEDDEWAARASADIVVQHRIEAVLYEYDWAPKPLSWYGAARSPS